MTSHSPKSSRVKRFHTRTVFSPHPDAMRLPSGLNAIEVTPLDNAIEVTLSECPFNVATHSPVAASHTRTVASSIPDIDAMRLPSGLNATEVTQSECPSSVATHSQVAASHTRTVASSPPDIDAMRLRV